MDEPSTRTGSKMKVRTTNAIAAATTITMIHSKISRFMLFLGLSFSWAALAAPFFCSMGIAPLLVYSFSRPFHWCRVQASRCARGFSSSFW